MVRGSIRGEYVRPRMGRVSITWAKLQGRSVETIENCLKMGSRYRVQGEIAVRPEIFGSISWCTVGYELAAIDDGSAAKQRRHYRDLIIWDW